MNTASFPFEVQLLLVSMIVSNALEMEHQYDLCFLDPLIGFSYLDAARSTDYFRTLYYENAKLTASIFRSQQRLVDQYLFDAQLLDWLHYCAPDYARIALPSGLSFNRMKALFRWFHDCHQIITSFKNQCCSS